MIDTTSSVVDVRQFETADHNASLKTSQLQQAIDTCFKAGGGTVLFPPGVYRTGTLTLRSNVTLHLAVGAVLLGSDDMSAYRKAGGGQLGILYAADAENITIEGRGTIDGNGRAFIRPGEFHFETGSFDPSLTRQGQAMLHAPGGMADGPVAMKPRPGQAMVFERCRNVVVRDVTIRDTPHWASNFSDCDLVRIHGVTIDNDVMIPNSDGLHFNCTRDIVVSDCNIRGGDDAIAISSFTEHDDFPGFTSPNRPCGRMAVSNCLLVSRPAGIRIGAGQADIGQVVVNNVVIRDSNRGVLISQRDGCVISDILLSNLVIETRLMAGGWWGKGEPISISSMLRSDTAPTGRIERVRISNVSAIGEAGIILWADHGCELRSIDITDLSLTIRPSERSRTHGGNIDLRPVTDLRRAVFRHDLAAILCRQAQGVRLNRVTVELPTDLPEYVLTKPCWNLHSDIMLDGAPVESM